MASIRPFRGLRYSDAAGPLKELVAPPYDVISWDERNCFAAKNDCNVVLLTLPESNDDDRSKYVKYARSAARLEEWRREGKLAVENAPAFYRYRQTFKIPGSDDSVDRLSLISAIKVEPYEKGVVLPHEQTFPKHKEDRLRVLEATRAHLECIYGLYEDDDASVFNEVLVAPATTVADVTTEDGVRHVVDRIDDPKVCAKISSLIGPKKVWIADGHHRYETACTFRAEQGERDHLIAEDFMMMALSSISDPGLVLLPTHRKLSGDPLTLEQAEQALSPFFETRRTRNEDLINAIEAAATEGVGAFGIALRGGEGLVALIERSAIPNDLEPGAGQRLRNLDVTVLHRLILERLLDVHGLERISYTRDPIEALESVKNEAAAAFLMNPPTVDDMREIALNGEKMPQKSTYYYPKILSGLVLFSLNDMTP